jgi:hypothetical protein
MIVREENDLNIPVLSNIVEGMKSFLKTRRYVSYLIIFVSTTFLGLFVSWLMTAFTGVIQQVLFNFFAYVGAAGTIYFMIGTILTGLGLDKLWIKRRGRGKWNEMIGVAWMAISFAIAVFMSIFLGPQPLILFAMVCWVGWIAFQAYLSSRTSLRIATIAEPKKGGIAIGIGSFIVLLIGIGIIGAEILAALVLIPNNILGLGDALGAIFANYEENLTIHFPYITLAMALLALFAFISFLVFLRYAKKGAALNVALLTVFIAIYSGYFLFNVLRRGEPGAFEPLDIFMFLFFLVYAMSGIGRTTIEAVEESKSRLRDLGPLLTFFLASGYVYVDSIIAAAAGGATGLAEWFQSPLIADTWAAFIFKDVAKLIAFPLVAIFTCLVYLWFERTGRIIERAKEEGETFEPGEVDEEIAERSPKPGEPWPSETAEGIPEGKPGHDLSAPDTKRLTVDSSRRLGAPKRLGEEEEEEED